VADVPRLDVAVAEAALPGEQESGDAHVVARHARGVLVAAIDGLGHGPEAARAAQIACEVIDDEPGADLEDLFVRAHGRLARSRGVVMSLASFASGGALTWLGVGNVEGTLLRSEDGPAGAVESILLRGGVVGYQLPTLRPSRTRVERGDTLVFATDGIAAAHRRALDPAAPTGLLADRILAEHAKGADDALVLVARYLG
jgi:phosphoserine phosphatase RsbX